MKLIKYLLVLLLFTTVHQLAFSQEEEVFMIVEEMPRFPGCEDLESTKEEKETCAKKMMFEYISNNLTYPKEAKENGIEGNVVIQFVVNKRGEIETPVIVLNIEGGCGEAALEVVESMNHMEELWTPGKQRGRKVKVKYTLPVNFELTDTYRRNEVLLDGLEEGLLGNDSAEEEIFNVVEEMPRFPGCEDVIDIKEKSMCSQRKMLEYLYRNLKYPPKARKNGIQGTAIIQFIVNKDGSLSGFNILKDPGSGCGEAALMVLESMKNIPTKWIPGKQRGRAVAVKYTMPVKFKLQ